MDTPFIPFPVLLDQLVILHLPQSLAPNATPWPNPKPNIDQGQRRQYYSGKEDVCPSDADAIYDELDGGDQDRCQATPHEVVLWHKVRELVHFRNRWALGLRMP